MVVEIFVVVVIAAAIVATVRERRAAADRVAKPGRPRPDLSTDRLASTLQEGQLPCPVPVQFPLQTGEHCLGVLDADVEQWLEGDGTYTSKRVGWAGGLVGLVVGSIVAAIGNARRRSQASREAAERWRKVGHYRIYVTTSRVVMEDGQSGWHDFWLSDFRRVAVDREVVVVQIAGIPAMRVYANPSNYWYLLLRALIFGERPVVNRSGWHNALDA